MLIAHEAPISILEAIGDLTDIQYALVHLCAKRPEYYNFFKISLAQGREVMLDNSIFELGTAFDSAKFADYIDELRPTHYIVPDVLEDCEGTIASYHTFTQDYQMLPGMKIGVVQGKNYDDIVKCYRYMDDNSDYIAISFDYSLYQFIGRSSSNVGGALARLERMCSGRYQLIKMLKSDGIWNNKKPHHLLGCSLAKEFSYYTYDRSIRSVDTSNPVVAGLLGQRYMSGIGLRDKSSIMLADLIDSEVNEDQMTDIIYNVEEFKKICSL